MACKYISKPHLINGFKYDLRVYVLVSSFDPLRVYVFEEGLVRFATEKYSTNSKTLRKRFVHLTNYSVNKKAAGYTALNDKKDEELCAKWDLRTLRKKFTELGLDYDKVFKRVHDVIIKGLISIEPHIVNNMNRLTKHKNVCFEVYGFDVLLDQDLKAWLLEVNVCPSLSSSSPMDKRIKTSMLTDAFNLIGI